MPLTSALLPTETKLDIPRSRRVASLRMAMPSPPRLRREADAPAERRNRCERRIHRDVRRRVDDAHAVRADEAHAVPARPARPARAPLSHPPHRSRRTRRLITTSPPTCLLATRLDDRGHAGAGTAMTARSTCTGSSDTDEAAGSPAISASGRVDGVDGSVEAAREQVRQQLMTDRAVATARPDDRNRGRSKDRRHRARRRNGGPAPRPSRGRSRSARAPS